MTILDSDRQTDRQNDRQTECRKTKCDKNIQTDRCMERHIGHRTSERTSIVAVKDWNNRNDRKKDTYSKSDKNKHCNSYRRCFFLKRINRFGKYIQELTGKPT